MNKKQFLKILNPNSKISNAFWFFAICELKLIDMKKIIFLLAVFFCPFRRILKTPILFLLLLSVSTRAATTKVLLPIIVCLSNWNPIIPMLILTAPLFTISWANTKMHKWFWLYYKKTTCCWCLPERGQVFSHMEIWDCNSWLHQSHWT